MMLESSQSPPQLLTNSEGNRGQSVERRGLSQSEGLHEASRNSAKPVSTFCRVEDQQLVRQTCAERRYGSFRI